MVVEKEMELVSCFHQFSNLIVKQPIQSWTYAIPLIVLSQHQGLEGLEEIREMASAFWASVTILRALVTKGICNLE